ncbi:hypothetical protein Nepgr_004078 [Nepenthes gracilis]|uniref:Uncharacterized protein n=1 Tax=Nepenthes gracilis TaxID=150966 RepID=A0AAD3S0S5_NEPGR|nr:hypothetical protein Nepgr_004078 [Nepenthes gracilis]
MAGPLEAPSGPPQPSSSPLFSPFASPRKGVATKFLAQSSHSFPLLKRDEFSDFPVPNASFLERLKPVELRNSPLLAQHAKSPGPAEIVATERWSCFLNCKIPCPRLPMLSTLPRKNFDCFVFPSSSSLLILLHSNFQCVQSTTFFIPSVRLVHSSTH